MKALTIKQPYASLIAENIKHVETRTWKTNFRGEVLIHAGKAKEMKNILEYKDVLDIDNLPYSNIIAKCKIVDCIKMDEEYIKKYNKENEGSGYYLTNESVGKYAFVLENIEKIENIHVNGKLSFWEYEYREDK